MALDHPTVYVPGFEHDVFISYSSIDDQPEPGAQGRVSTFVDQLTKRLKILLGEPDFALWMDRTRLDGTTRLTPGIEKPLKKTAVMVAFLSNGYLKSKWCPKERKVFLEAVGPVEDYARLFVVELDRVEPDQQPKEFADLLAYRLWVQGSLDKNPRWLEDPHDPDYRDRLDALARDLKKVLERLRERGTPPPPQAKTTVYLSQVTDDLDSLRLKVKSYLEQQQIEVLPKQQYLPLDPDAFRQAVVSSLADADLFVQLLSKVPGRRMDESQTYVAFQHTCAREVGLPILQWRDPSLTEQSLSEVESAAHRELLDGPNVQAVQIEEFKQEILRTLERQRAERERQDRLAKKSQEAARGQMNDKFIFIVADPKDGPVAQAIFEYLGRQGYKRGLPLAVEDQTGLITPADIRRDFEDNVQLADGMVIVYGQTPPAWYRSQLSEVRKIQVQCGRDGKRCRVGLFVAPPPKNVGYQLPGMCLIPGHEGIDEMAFQTFLDTLLEGVPQGRDM
jgi:hypothetical protein